MANNPQQPNPFMPSFEGPFESTIEQGLRPPSPLTVQNPQANVSKLAAAAGLTSKLLEGIQQGAMRKYVQTERVKQTQRESVNAQLASIKNNDQVSQEHKAQLEKIVNGAMMGYTAQQIEDAHKANQDETGGKKGKSKQPEKPIDHVRNFLVTGLRKASGVPEGSKPIDLNGLNTLMASTFDEHGNVKPEYSAAKQKAAFDSKLNAATQGATDQTDFYRKAGPLYEQGAKVYGQEWPNYLNTRARGFENLNPDQRTERTLLSGAPPNSGQPQAQPPASAAPPGPPVTPGAPAPSVAQSTPPPGGQTPAYDPTRALLFKRHGLGTIGEPKKVEVIGPDGSKAEATAFEVRNPEFSGWVDASTNKPTLGYVNLVSTSQPREPSPDERLQKTANEFYKETHGIKDRELTKKEQAKAQSELKDARESSDVHIQKQVFRLEAQEKIEKIKNDRSDVKEIAQAIIDGRQPPDLSNRITGQIGAIRAELERHGFDLKQAQYDYQATQQWIKSVNSSQQIRLRQATNFSMESLDVVDNLSDELTKEVPRGKYPIVNKGAMLAAKQGLLGQKAQEAARQLDIQIIDLQSEIAQVYRGGGSPTDKGLKQAQDILNEDWDQKTLKKATDLARTNLGYRLNSIRNSGPLSTGGYTGGGAAPPAPPPGAAAPNPTWAPGGSAKAAQHPTADNSPFQ